MTQKQVRWRCPTCQVAVLAPSRPRKNDTRRYCLDCSAKSPRLVERVPVALEQKRKERKKKAARKAAAKRVFKHPDTYYYIGGRDIRQRLRLIPDTCIRVRTTKTAGPVRVFDAAKDGGRGSFVVFRKGTWADRWDVEAQALVADARWEVALQHDFVSRAKLRPALKVATIRGFVRASNGGAYPFLKEWRPRALAKLETSLADLLRKNAAVELLTESSEVMERTG